MSDKNENIPLVEDEFGNNAWKFTISDVTDEINIDDPYLDKDFNPRNVTQFVEDMPKDTKDNMMKLLLIDLWVRKLQVK